MLACAPLQSTSGLVVHARNQASDQRGANERGGRGGGHETEARFAAETVNSALLAIER
jgi:hypothetical protein